MRLRIWSFCRSRVVSTSSCFPNMETRTSPSFGLASTVAITCLPITSEGNLSDTVMLPAVIGARGNTHGFLGLILGIADLYHELNLTHRNPGDLGDLKMSETTPVKLQDIR